MNPRSKEEAFKIIDNSTSGIPFAAIKYLYTHDNDQEILDKVYFSIDNAYNLDIYYDKKTDYYNCTPLWYSIVAENHLNEKLVSPVLNLYTTTNEDSGFLNEQGLYLLCKFCEKYRKSTIDKCLDICIDLNNQNSQLPYLFLFECLNYTKKGEYDSQILDLLKDPNAKWMDAIIGHLCDPKFINILPRILEIQEYYQAITNKTIIQNHTLIELKATIKTIRTSDSESLSLYPPYSEKREHWELHYKSIEHIFKDEPEEIKNTKKKKIGRNDPCPCGSGKKYKKCCLML